jgi:hypothetical protein
MNEIEQDPDIDVNDSSNNELVECPVCFDEAERRLCRTLTCGHCYCKSVCAHDNHDNHDNHDKHWLYTDALCGRSASTHT